MRTSWTTICWSARTRASRRSPTMPTPRAPTARSGTAIPRSPGPWRSTPQRWHGGRSSIRRRSGRSGAGPTRMSARAHSPTRAAGVGNEAGDGGDTDLRTTTGSVRRADPAADAAGDRPAHARLDPRPVVCLPGPWAHARAAGDDPQRGRPGRHHPAGRAVRGDAGTRRQTRLAVPDAPDGGRGADLADRSCRREPGG